MDKFKMTCPDCRAEIITQSPKALIWELCPGCRRHIWDIEDIMMADVYVTDRTGAEHGASLNN